MSSRFVAWYDKDFNIVERPCRKEIEIDFETFCKWKDEINILNSSITSFFDEIISSYPDEDLEPDFSDVKVCNYIKSKIKETFGIQQPNGTLVNFDFLGSESGEGYFLYVDNEVYSFQEPDSYQECFNFCWTPKQLLTFDKIAPGYVVCYDNPIWLDYDNFYHQINKENIVKHEDNFYLKIVYKDDVYYLGKDENILEDILEGNYNIFFVTKDGTIV